MSATCTDNRLFSPETLIGFEHVIGMLGGKWKLRILHLLGQNKSQRYGELKRAIPTITHKMLSSQLKELELDGLLIRSEVLQIPLRVDYALSAKALALLPVFLEMCHWLLAYPRHEEGRK